MERLREARKQRELTQVVLAKKVSVSQAYINQLENGKRQPSMRVFVKIAKVLNCSLEELL